MINTKRDIDLYWTSSRSLLPFLSTSQGWSEFPTFNVSIYNPVSGQQLIKNYPNISSPDNARIMAREDVDNLRQFLEYNSYAIYANTRARANIINTSVQYSTFKLSLEENLKIYEEKNNSLGYYKNLSFYIYFYEEADSQFIDIEYPQINIDIDASGIFEKINRSTDNVAIKFKINNEKFNLKEVESMYVFPKAKHSNNVEIQLSSLFVDQIKYNWLSTVDETKILTVPLIETAIAEEADYIDLDIYLLNFHQSEIVRYLKSINFNNLKIEEFIKSFFSNQRMQYFNLEKGIINNGSFTPSSSLDVNEQIQQLKSQIDILSKQIKNLEK